MKKLSVSTALKNELNRWNVHKWKRCGLWSKAYAHRAENDIIYTWVICENGYYAYKATGQYDIPYQLHSDSADAFFSNIIPDCPYYIVDFDCDIFHERTKAARKDFYVKLGNTVVNGKYLKRILKVIYRPSLFVSDSPRFPVIITRFGVTAVLMPVIKECNPDIVFSVAN